jgi:hypothetical protein
MDKGTDVVELVGGIVTLVGIKVAVRTFAFAPGNMYVQR